LGAATESRQIPPSFARPRNLEGFATTCDQKKPVDDRRVASKSCFSGLRAELHRVTLCAHRESSGLSAVLWWLIQPN